MAPVLPSTQSSGRKMEPHSTAPGIKLNGQPRPLPAGGSVAALLDELGFTGQPVLVECNGVALFPRDFAATRLTGGEAVEIIRIVAGG